MGGQGRSLYVFVGIQSFLIGLFPFYIPVYLFKAGESLALIFAFISATGLGFVFSLYLWDRVARTLPLNRLMIISLLSEWGLVSLFFLDVSSLFIPGAGVVNGIFNCSFWMIQRLLFLDTVTPGNSGRKFGNFQIVVFLVVKIGIFAGGFLLDHYSFGSVFLGTAAVAGAGTLYFTTRGRDYSFDDRVVKSAPLKFRAAAAYRDSLNSRPVFAVDGVFLYLESYFWMISLFLVVKQRFWTLGGLVIVLALIFSLMFVMVKNRIDRMPVNAVYRWAVILYGISWILRGMLDHLAAPVFVFVLLAAITFCTSIFRLAFNKRFYDIAASTSGHEYIFIKSYISQSCLVLAALAGALSVSSTSVLPALYFSAAPLSLVYLWYHDISRAPSAGSRENFSKQDAGVEQFKNSCRKG